MPSPFARSTPAPWPFGPGQTTDHLTSLPNDAARGLGSILCQPIPGTTYNDIIISPVQVRTGAANVGGEIALYLVASEDDVVFDGLVNPNTLTNQIDVLPYLKSTQQIEVFANSSSYAFREFTVWTTLGFVPAYVAIVIANKSGAALNTSAVNFSAKWVAESYL